MTPVILADLDDTIFTTLKNYQERDPDTLKRVTTAKNGNHSFMCEHRQAILAWLAAGATLLPVTARSLDAFRRVHLDIFTEGAIVSNGAMVLNRDGSEDLTWSKHVAELCRESDYIIESAAELISQLPINVRIHRHEHREALLGMTVKSNVESDDGVKMNLGFARQAFIEKYPHSEVSVHMNGNNLAFVPGGVSKRSAVQYLLSIRDDLQDRPTIGAGDSLADLPFMELCSMMLVPNKTQNSQKLFA
ncbi:hypothetical protein KUV57_13310 [Epibacterium sp. DP7N7-1]|nr:hypothetical protein [Epibacterium sp. DP7N7-1]